MSDRLTQWLAILANLYGPHRAEAAAAFKTYAPMLGREFPTDALTGSSALHVATECPSVPTFGKLSQALREWWKIHQPYVPRIAPPAQPLDPEREEWRAMPPEAKAAAIAAIKAKYANMFHHGGE